jgi:hypothetical protein
MPLHHSNNIDARGSTINNIGRDQTYNNTTVYQSTTQINISLFGSHPLSDALSRPILVPDSEPPETLPPRSLPLTTSPRPNTVTVVEIAIGLVVKITGRLIYHSDSSNNHLDLQFKSLHQTLTLAACAIKVYSDRPLGQSLANTIGAEAEHCYILLLELLGKVDDTRVGLNLTGIRGLWRPVWWCRWDGGEFALLGRKLSGIQESLEGFLMALHSYVALAFHMWSATNNVISLHTNQL